MQGCASRQNLLANMSDVNDRRHDSSCVQHAGFSEYTASLGKTFTMSSTGWLQCVTEDVTKVSANIHVQRGAHSYMHGIDLSTVEKRNGIYVSGLQLVRALFGVPIQHRRCPTFPSFGWGFRLFKHLLSFLELSCLIGCPAAQRWLVRSQKECTLRLGGHALDIPLLLVVSLLLVAMPFVTSSILLLVVRPGATTSVLLFQLQT